MTKRRIKRPHNARVNAVASFDELLSAAAARMRKVVVDDRDVKITREEVIYRLTINRALEGSVRDLCFLIKCMVKRPDLASTDRVRRIFVINGVLAG